MPEKCKKSFCLKQVNPNIPGLYFGVPFQRDENYGECYLCELEDRREGNRTDLFVSNRFTRMAPSP